MSSPKVAVVILNWNGQEFLQKFLPPVIASEYDNLEIYIADNASTDNSVEYIEKEYPDINLIKLASNEGFAGGYNRALEEICSDYYVLLNQDVEVIDNWISPIIDLMEMDEQIAACQPKIRSFQEKNKFEYAGAAGGFRDSDGYTFCRSRLFDLSEEDKGQYDEEQEIFWASGACMFIRAKLFHGFGGFDKDFFAHMEEIDLCWRMKNAGYKVYYCFKSVVYHVGGGSLPQGSPRKTFLNYRNSLIMLFKNLSFLKLIWLLPFRFFLDSIAALKSLVNGNWKDSLAIIKAQWNFTLRIGKWIGKRINTRGMVKKPNRKGIYKGMLIADYFFFNKKKYSDLKN
ncbi:MAG: glycosyltransferase family 2 protein [Bacteroidetes bacterium]|nr:glycosyltransferase family 2 protein [Bacteroidota bacterium]